jgi:hypothetical protein
VQPGTALLGTGAAPCALLRLPWHAAHIAAVQPVHPRLTLDGSHHAMSAHRDPIQRMRRRTFRRRHKASACKFLS